MPGDFAVGVDTCSLGHDNPAASEPQREERGLALYQGHTGSLAFRVIGGGVVHGL